MLFEGDCIGKAIKTEVGMKNGVPTVRIEMEATEGEHKGRRAAYEGKLDEKNVRFTKRAMIAVGWKGKSVTTFADDVKAANLTVPYKVKIASWTRPSDGKLVQWSAVDYIGGAAKPLESIDAEKAKDFDRWLAEAGDVGDSAKADDNSIPF